MAYTIQHRPGIIDGRPWAVADHGIPFAFFPTREKAEAVAAYHATKGVWPEMLAALGFSVARECDILARGEVWEKSEPSILPYPVRGHVEEAIAYRAIATDPHNWLYLWRKVA